MFLCDKEGAALEPHQGDLIIGNDVWIGYGATILRATVGNGCIIGAGAVVRGFIPPYSVVIGNPAKIIRYRFSEEWIQKLEQIQWWSWPEERIRQEASLLTNDVAGFISKHWQPLKNPSK
jgi:virginiamycin A acetyltransferase